MRQQLGTKEGGSISLERGLSQPGALARQQMAGGSGWLPRAALDNK